MESEMMYSVVDYSIIRRQMDCPHALGGCDGCRKTGAWKRAYAKFSGLSRKEYLRLNEESWVKKGVARAV